MSDMHNYIDMMLKSGHKIVVSSDATRTYVNIGYFTSDYLIAMFHKETGDFISYIKKWIENLLLREI